MEKAKIFRETSEQDVMEKVQADRRLYLQYLDMEKAWQTRFTEICAGKKTWPLLYDSFFKRIFHPDIHPERLESFIECMLKQKAKIKGILPLEDVMMDGQALLVMDILVELKNGSLVLVEIQKIPYDFPAERASCYSADMLLRQYTKVKSRRGKAFQYSDLKKVYTIVFYEKSTEDTGEAEQLCSIYPWLEEIYREMAEFSRNPEEVLNMFSEALRVMDQNLAKYTMKKQEAQIEEQKKVLAEQEKEIEKNRREIEQTQCEIEKKNDEIEKMRLEIAQLKEQLTTKI